MSVFTWVEPANLVSYLPHHDVNDWVGGGVRGDVLVVLSLPERNHVVPERPGHSEPAQPVGLVLCSPTRAGHRDLSALVAVQSPRQTISPVSSPHIDWKSHLTLGSKLTFFSPNLLMRSSSEEILKEEAAPIRKATTRSFILQLFIKKNNIRVECTNLFLGRK